MRLRTQNAGTWVVSGSVSCRAPSFQLLLRGYDLLRPRGILGLMSDRLDTPDGARPTAARNELGDFLRSRRAKLSAEALGLSNQRRRRTPGLRREEVAERAGIGVDWYIRLEQGRSVSPSSATVDALAKALCLSKVEHAHLRALATTSHRAAFCRETVPDELRRMLAKSEQSGLYNRSQMGCSRLE